MSGRAETAIGCLQDLLGVDGEAHGLAHPGVGERPIGLHARDPGLRRGHLMNFHMGNRLQGVERRTRYLPGPRVRADANKMTGVGQDADGFFTLWWFSEDNFLIDLDDVTSEPYESDVLPGDISNVACDAAVMWSGDGDCDAAFGNLIMRAVDQSMVMSPPLTITKGEIDELLEKAERCLDLTARDLGLS